MPAAAAAAVLNTKTGRKFIGFGVAAIAAVIVLIIGIALYIGSIIGGSSSNGGGGSTLNPAGIPAADVAWIEQAGTLCPQISAPLLAAQLHAESGFDDNATSNTGAQGVAQFEPSTWPSWSQPPAVPGPDVPTNPADAIMAQGRFMCSLAAQAAASHITTASVVDLALAGYNAGFGAVQKAGGIPQNGQTPAYVSEIEASIKTYTASLANGGTGTAVGTSAGALATVWPSVLAFLQQQIGKPYVWGATGPGSYDCSGLVLKAYQSVGINLPRTSEDQYAATKATGVPYAQAQPRDLLFFEGDPPGHVAISVGNGQMIQAPHTGAFVDQVPVPSGLTGGVATIP